MQVNGIVASLDSDCRERDERATSLSDFASTENKRKPVLPSETCF